MQPSGFASFQRQLAEARNELEAFRQQQSYKDQLHEVALKQQRDQTLRLENIIAACVALLSTGAGVPAYLHRMIEHDAPGALKPFTHAVPECSAANAAPCKLMEATDPPSQSTIRPFDISTLNVAGTDYGSIATELQDFQHGFEPWSCDHYLADFMNHGN